MKNSRRFAKIATHQEKMAVSVAPVDKLPMCDISIKLDPFDTTFLGKGISNWAVSPIHLDRADRIFKNLEDNRSNLPPLATPEQLKALDEFVKKEEFAKRTTRTAFEEAHAKLDEAWIQTYTGRRFSILNPKVEDVCIEDIAHALSLICRFTGHASEFYSVAQHSVLVSYLCHQENALYGLMHDQAEAYCGDCSAPLKRLTEMAGFKKLEKGIHQVCCRKFGMRLEEPKDVKRADLMALGIEAQTFLHPKRSDWKFPVEPPPFLRIVPLSPKEAEQLFLNRFHELFDIDNDYDC